MSIVESLKGWKDSLTRARDAVAEASRTADALAAARDRLVAERDALLSGLPARADALERVEGIVASLGRDWTRQHGVAVIRALGGAFKSDLAGQAPTYRGPIVLDAFTGPATVGCQPRARSHPVSTLT